MLWSYEGLEIVFAWFIFMAQQSGDYPNVKVIYLVLHPLLAFCVVRKRATGPYYISWPIVSKEYPDKQVGALMWAPDGPDTPNLRLPGSFFNKALMLAEQLQCFVSLIVRWEPSGMLMNIQWGFVSRTVLCYLRLPVYHHHWNCRALLLGFYYKGDIYPIVMLIL